MEKEKESSGNDWSYIKAQIAAHPIALLCLILFTIVGALLVSVWERWLEHMGADVSFAFGAVLCGMIMFAASRLFLEDAPEDDETEE